MKSKKVILIGAGGHARSCIDVIETSEEFLVGAIVGQSCELGNSISGHLVTNVEGDLNALRLEYEYALVAVGSTGDNEIRSRLYEKILKEGFILPTIISKMAYVSKSASIGCGTIVMHGVIVNAGATVGDNCILNSKSLIEHDTIVGDHSHISTSSVVNGGAKIGESVFVGSGSCIRDNICIGNKCIIGMGQIVYKDLVCGTKIPILRQT
jgi:sugar O-acyltransferase (sialic acid O-acetyltransferase NeuD family)